jgi:hypothetical protein
MKGQLPGSFLPNQLQHPKTHMILKKLRGFVICMIYDKPASDSFRPNQLQHPKTHMILKKLRGFVICMIYERPASGQLPT